MSEDVQKTIALVTGAGGGIGRATAIMLAERGVSEIFVTYARSGGAAQETVALVEALGAKATAVQCDISDPLSVVRLVDQVRAAGGRLDYLVNNAGTTEFVPMRDLDAATPEIWDKLWRTNVLGAFEVTRAASDLLKVAEGAVVNVTSLAGHRVTGSSLPYGVTKAAALQLSRALAVSLAPDVRVNSVSPGMVRSGWNQRFIDSGEFDANEARDAVKIPLERYADPEDVAEAIVGLLEMTFVTGQDVIVDGGRVLGY